MLDRLFRLGLIFLYLLSSIDDRLIRRESKIETFVNSLSFKFLSILKLKCKYLFSPEKYFCFILFASREYFILLRIHFRSSSLLSKYCFTIIYVLFTNLEKLFMYVFALYLLEESEQSILFSKKKKFLKNKILSKDTVISTYFL